MHAALIPVQVTSPADALRGELSAIIESVDELQINVTDVRYSTNEQPDIRLDILLHD